MSEYFAARAARSAKVLATCTAVAEAMGWAFKPIFDTNGDGLLYRAELTHESGFVISLFSGYDSERIEASVSWPRYVNGEYRTFSHGAGNYGHAAPKTTFAVTRNPKHAAAQVLRDVFTERARDTWAAFAERDRLDIADRDGAVIWREAIAKALGCEVRSFDNGGGLHHSFGKYNPNLGIKVAADRPSGTVEVAIPADPAKAAALISAIREALK